MSQNPQPDQTPEATRPNGGERHVPTPDTPERVEASGREGEVKGSILVVSSDSGRRAAAARVALSIGRPVTEAASANDAEIAMTAGLVDVVIIDGALPSGSLSLAERLSELGRSPAMVLFEKGASLDRAIEAMRCGVSDIIDPSSPAPHQAERMAAALTRAESGQRRSQRERRLQQLCQKLNEAREEVTEHLGSLANDLAGAYSELTDQVGDVALASELNSLLRQELDVESLLRTLLEFLLSRIGSTNAGIFLPTNSGEYSLGAYINYDVPKESAEVMLDQLSGVLAPKFEGQSSVRRIEDAAAMAEALGEDAHWMEGQSMLVVACHEDPNPAGLALAADEPIDEPECLAVLCVFRDKRSPFPASAAPLFQIAADLFGRQLARVIKVHHRATGADEQDDSFGWAA